MQPTTDQIYYGVFTPDDEEFVEGTKAILKETSIRRAEWYCEKSWEELERLGYALKIMPTGGKIMTTVVMLYTRSDDPQPVIIRIEKELPELEASDNYSRFFSRDAKTLAAVLIKALPQGTIEQLTNLLMDGDNTKTRKPWQIQT